MKEPTLFSPRKITSTSCGLYRTDKPLITRSGTSRVEIPAGRLVSFHNHGDPGPGIYPVKGWKSNRAIFATSGMVVEPEYAKTLIPLPPEGFYRVVQPFACCEKNCRTFEAESLVQLGYNGQGQGIVFSAVWEDTLYFMDKGSLISDENFQFLAPLKVMIPPDPTGHHHV